MSNVDINVDGWTENRTPISHPATSRCDKKHKKYFDRRFQETAAETKV